MRIDGEMCLREALKKELPKMRIDGEICLMNIMSSYHRYYDDD